MPKRQTNGSVLPPEPLKPTTSVACGIVVYNNSDDQISDLSLSIKSQTVSDALLRTYVWDNGSIKNYECLSSVFSGSDKTNLGFGKSHNILMKKAFDSGAHYYIGINPDGILHPECIQRMLSMAQKFSDRALIEAVQCPVEHPKPYDPFTFDTPWASGACFLISRLIWETVGGFDENLFMYCEDVDLSWSVKAAGFSVKTCPTALFYHDTTDRRPHFAKDKLLFLSARYLGEKWGCSEFRQLVDRLMVEQGYIPDARYLPDIQISQVRPLDTNIVEFRQLFNFALPRW